MSWIVAIVVGAIVGWLASLVMKTNAQQGWLTNILIGIVGAVLGKWLFADVLGIGGAAAAGTFSIIGIFWAVIGAVILIAILRAFKVFS